MAQTIKVLAQASPAASTLTDIYTVPALTTTVVSSIVVCNLTAIDALFRIAIAVAGAANEDKQYIYDDVTVPGNDTFVATVGLTLGAGDVVRVYDTSDRLAFSLFGTENS